MNNETGRFEQSSDSPTAASRLTDEKRRIAERRGPDRPRRVLLIGGAGYIGSPVTSHLLSIGYGVTTLDLLLYRQGSTCIGHLGHPDYRLLIGDMGDDAALDRALEDATDVVILAGMVGDPITKKFPQESAAINDAAVRTCIDRLNNRGLDRVIFISTCSNYGLVDGDEMVDEKSPLAPLSLYARSKVAAEQYLLSLRGKVDYHPTILRFATAFGLAARMRFDLTVNQFTRELFLGRELVVYDAHTWRPYCHVKDFARLIAHVLAFPAKDVEFEIFNAGAERNNATKKQIVESVAGRLSSPRISYGRDSADKRNYRVNFSKLRTVLGFEPAYSIEDGIDEILWALRSGLLEDVDRLPDIYGNYALPALQDRPLSADAELLQATAGR